MGGSGGSSAVEIRLADYGIDELGAEEQVLPENAATICRQAVAERKNIVLIQTSTDAGELVEMRFHCNLILVSDSMSVFSATINMFGHTSNAVIMVVPEAVVVQGTQ